MHTASALGIFMAGLTHNREKWETISRVQEQKSIKWLRFCHMYNAPQPLEMLTHKYFCYRVFLTNIQQIVLCFGLQFFFKVCVWLCVWTENFFYLIYTFEFLSVVSLSFLWNYIKRKWLYFVQHAIFVSQEEIVAYLRNTVIQRSSRGSHVFWTICAAASRQVSWWNGGASSSELWLSETQKACKLEPGWADSMLLSPLN